MFIKCSFFSNLTVSNIIVVKFLTSIHVIQINFYIIIIIINFISLKSSSHYSLRNSTHKIFKIPITNTSLARSKFWYWVAVIGNMINNFNWYNNKDYQTILFKWVFKMFLNNYHNDISCTWSLLCLYNSCVIQKISFKNSK